MMAFANGFNRRLSLQEQQMKEMKVKKTGGGAMSNAEFYDGAHVKCTNEFLPVDVDVPKLKTDFTAMLEHEKADIAERTKSDPKFRANESNTVQLSWSAYLSDAGLTIGSKTLKFDKPKQMNKKKITLQWIDRHTVQSIGSRKPDECLYVVAEPAVAFNIVVVGDLKDPGVKFTTDAKGHILSFMVRLFDFQPSRRFVIGYLRNSEVIQFFHAARTGQTFSYSESEEMNWTLKGGGVFASLLTSDLSALGWTVPTLPWEDVKVTGYLGAGLSCTAYATDHGSVAKIFHEKTEEGKQDDDFDTELENLKEVNKCPALKGFVPVIVSSDESRRMMLVAPIGKHYTDDVDRVGVSDEVGRFPQYAIFGRKHMEQLIDIVKNSPLVHRDLHLNNLYVTDDGDLLCNDWALAVKPKTQVYFAGVDAYVSFNVLEKKGRREKYPALRKDDLHAIVRIAYCILHPHDFKLMNATNVKEFWKSRLGNGNWEAAELAAAADDPDNLKAVLIALFPW
jgi:hypothetical protein